MMEMSEILDILGWDDKALKIMKTLLMTKNCTVTNLSVLSGYDRGICYRTVELFKRIGIIKTTLSNPLIIEIASKEEILTGIKLKLDDDSRRKLDAYTSLMEEMENIRILKNVSGKSEFTIINGTPNIWSMFSKKIKLAKNQIIFLVSGDELHKMKHSTIYETLLESTVDRTIITDDGKYDIKKSSTLKFAPNIQKIKGRILLIDDNYVVFSGGEMIGFNNDTDSCVVTNDAGVVDQYKKLLEPYLLNANTDLSIYNSIQKVSKQK